MPKNDFIARRTEMRRLESRKIRAMSDDEARRLLADSAARRTWMMDLHGAWGQNHDANICVMLARKLGLRS